jgi:hypothetical protein
MEIRIHLTATFMFVIYLTALIYGVCNYHSVPVVQTQHSELSAFSR